MCPGVQTGGTKYWEYVLCYADDTSILCCSKLPQNIMDAIVGSYKLKDGSVKLSDLYLGADVNKWYITDSDKPNKVRWAMSSTNYTWKAVEEVERELRETGLKQPTKVTTPLSSGYRPEINMTAKLDAEQHNYYQRLNGVLR
jgi:hypothetical protein